MPTTLANNKSLRLFYRIIIKDKQLILSQRSNGNVISYHAPISNTQYQSVHVLVPHLYMQWNFLSLIPSLRFIRISSSQVNVLMMPFARHLTFFHDFVISAYKMKEIFNEKKKIRSASFSQEHDAALILAGKNENYKFKKKIHFELAESAHNFNYLLGHIFIR